MTSLFIKVLNLSITASYVALVVLLVRLLLKKSPKVFSYMLWSVVLFRLVCPIHFSCSFSVLQPINSSSNYISQNIGMMESPTILPNIETVDGAMNNLNSTAIPFPSADPMQIVLSVFTSIWILGIVLLILYSIYSYFKVHQKIQFATLVKENIYETDQMITPFVFGLIKPKIYLPKGLETNEMDYIIHHERIHIRRLDYLIKPISFLVLTLHWFNPLMWICYYLMVKDMEMSCDESVLEKSGGDLRGPYSSSLLNLSIKHSRLLLPLAFGESNIKSRIKNILNYKKPSFWSIFIAVIILIAISIALITNPVDDSAKYNAKKFLRAYYTIENTDLADKLSDPSFMDLLASSNLEIGEQGLSEFREFSEGIKEKYGDLMTENALHRAMANRILLAGEIAAKEYGSRLIPERVHLYDENTSKNGDVSYRFSIEALVKFKEGSKEWVTLYGDLVMEKVEGHWKVGDFQPDRVELAKILQFGKSYLFITNQSDAPIRKVEVSTKQYSGGIMNADNTDMVKNARVDFEMEDAEDLQFVLRLSDGDDSTLLQKSFKKDFSEGKDVHLYIREDHDGKLIIQQ